MLIKLNNLLLNFKLGLIVIQIYKEIMIKMMMKMIQIMKMMKIMKMIKIKTMYQKLNRKKYLKKIMS
jgi:hypothetical protein